MRPAVLALDLGSSGCKGAVFSADGSLLAEASHAYPTARPASLWVEQDPAHWWDAAVAVCRRLLLEVPAERIAGVGLSGQVPTMVLVDAAGQALALAISWQDRRAGVEAEWLREHVGAARLGEWLGLDLPVDAAYPPARLLWWRRHRPDLLARAHRVLMTKEFVQAQLTGAMSSDAWSAKGLVHLLTGAPTEAYYAALDVPSALAPAILAPSAVAGSVHRTAAEATGLLAGTPVVTGWSDALCGMVGTGGVLARRRLPAASRCCTGRPRAAATAWSGSPPGWARTWSPQSAPRQWSLPGPGARSSCRTCRGSGHRSGISVRAARSSACAASTARATAPVRSWRGWR